MLLGWMHFLRIRGDNSGYNLILAKNCIALNMVPSERYDFMRFNRIEKRAEYIGVCVCLNKGWFSYDSKYRKRRVHFCSYCKYRKNHEDKNNKGFCLCLKSFTAIIVFHGFSLFFIHFSSTIIWQSSGLVVSDISTNYLAMVFELICAIVNLILLARISQPLTELCGEMGSILLYRSG